MSTAREPLGSAPDVLSLPWTTRVSQSLGALAKLAKDPYDTAQVFVLAVHLNAGAVHRRMPEFFATDGGTRLYREKMTIDSAHVDLAALARLPAGTLGHEYAAFLRDRDFSPDLFQPPDNVADPRATYVMQRMRQTHDVWHVLTGHATTPAGEVALQAFTFGQVRAPSALAIAILGTLRNALANPKLARDAWRAYRAGQRAAPLAAVVWEDLWAVPLDELRARFGVAAVDQGLRQ